MANTEAETHTEISVEGAACDLSPGDFESRVREWKALSRESLARRAEPGRVISTYPQTEPILQRLRHLIAAESECCPFLQFELREKDDRIEVELRYPDGFESVLDLVLPEPEPSTS